MQFVQTGFVVASWLKGKWRHHKSATDDVDKDDVEFKLADSNDSIFMGSKLTTVAEVMDERRLTNPAAKTSILYHKLKEDPSDDQPNHQLVAQVHRMVWKADAGVKVEVGAENTVLDYKHVAASIPVATWNGKYTSIVWAMKWTSAGLCPVRPQVMLTKDLQVAANQAVKL